MNGSSTSLSAVFGKEFSERLLNLFRFKSVEKTNSDSEGQKIVYGWPIFFIRKRLRLTIFRLAISKYKNPIMAIKVLQHFLKLRKSVKGNQVIRKMVKANGKYYMGLYIPGWNGETFKSFVLSELNRFVLLDEEVNRFNNVFLAITKKCILQCEHCFEWEALNKKDVLTSDTVEKIISVLQDKGVNQICFTGGEPMLKINMMINTMENAKNETDFWMLTSGYHLNLENAQKLKRAGLSGVVISLDHYLPQEHNKFRGNEKAFQWVTEAINSALENNLIVALSVCVTRSFATEENLLKYMNLAKELKVSFVQFLEPKAVGHYLGKDVILLPEHEAVLEKMYLKFNNHNDFQEYPLIVYHGFHQRKRGCFNAGLMGLYVDTDGQINACPFCHDKTGNVLDDNFEENLNKLKQKGCPSYHMADH
ncbi:MAG: radical SAM protein [Lutibacter sp.]